MADPSGGRRRPDTGRATYYVWARQHGDVLAEWYRYPPGPAGVTPSHAHAEYQLCLASGSASRYLYRGGWILVPPGSVSVLMPDEVHVTEEPEDRRDTTRYQVLYVGPDRVRDVAAAIGGRSRGLPSFAEAVLRDPDLAMRYQRLHAAFAAGSSQLGRDVDLLSMLYDLFSLMRKEGLLSLEQHVEDPQSSPLFSAYPRLLREHHLIEFTTDCLRLMVGGSMNPHELEQLLEVELEAHHHEAVAPALAVTKLADALPGFGIVAAVLGIVTTMSQLDGDTSRIGMHIAGALVGTFLGILLCYGFVGPLGAAMENRVQEDGKAFECVKIALLANLRGYNPKVSVEFARKSLSTNARPGFQDLEDHLKAPRAKATA